MTDHFGILGAAVLSWITLIFMIGRAIQNMTKHGRNLFDATAANTRAIKDLTRGLQQIEKNTRKLVEHDHTLRDHNKQLDGHGRRLDRVESQFWRRHDPPPDR